MPWLGSARAVPGEVYAKPWSELKPVKEGGGSRDKASGVHGISWDKSISSKAKLHSKAEESDLYHCCSGAGVRMGQMSIRGRISGSDYSAAGRQLIPLHVLASAIQSLDREWRKTNVNENELHF